jgi:tight adherence protein B
MMLMVVVMFVVGVGLVLGANFLLTKLPAILEQRRLNQRLMDVAGTPEPVQQGTEESLVMRDVSGPLPAVDRLVSSTQAGTWLTKLIQQAGVRTTPSAIAVSSIVLGAVFALAARMFAAGIPFLPFLVFLVGASVPVSVLLYKRSARLAKFEEQFPEALDLLARALRAGHAFQTAMGMVAEELKAPVGPEFKKTFDQQNFGLPLKECLFELADRVPLLDVRFFATAVTIQRETGGNLAEILDNLAYVVRERFKILRQVRVHTAHGRFTGYVLLALPAVLCIALSFINPEHMNLLFRERMGQMMLLGALGLQTTGYVWIKQVIKIEV